MQFKSTEYSSTPEILKRQRGAEFARPITIDADAFTNGVVKAGTPINKDGEVATTTSGENDAVGILWNDVFVENPNGSILYADAVINATVAQAWSGVTYDDALKTALSHLVFED